jgi:hypothetical protein
MFLGLILSVMVSSTESARNNWESIYGLGNASVVTCEQLQATAEAFGTNADLSNCETEAQLNAGRPGDDLPVLRVAEASSLVLGAASGIWFLVLRRKSRA